MIKKILIILFVIFLVGSKTDAQVSEIFLNRHSLRNYDASKRVTKEQLLAMIEAARWSASSHNEQPWFFIICNRNENPESYEKAFSCLKDTQQAWAKDADVLILVSARTLSENKGKPNYWAEYDTGAAAISMALQASELGLMAHQVGGFDKEKARTVFGLPDYCKPMAMMIVGYESSTPNPRDLPRVRKPVGDNFFDGAWNKRYE